jgi:alkylated DNA repair dioxygenase AlkB
MNAPITYDPAFLLEHQRGQYFRLLWESLPWERRDGAPRRECWLNPYGLPYTYGSGDHARTYEALPLFGWAEEPNSLVWGIMQHINNDHGSSFDCCFINGYEHGRQHLGWHADDSPEMDHDHPIAVVSLGAEREIWFRNLQDCAISHETGDEPYLGRQLLGDGSLLLMHAGMQREWQHRIPKSSVADCGPRISLTYRKLVR